MEEFYSADDVTPLHRKKTGVRVCVCADDSIKRAQGDQLFVIVLMLDP